MTEQNSRQHRFTLSDGRVVCVSPSSKNPKKLHIIIGDPPQFIDDAWSFESFRSRRILCNAAELSADDEQLLLQEVSRVIQEWKRSDEEKPENSVSLAITIRRITQPKSDSEFVCVASYDDVLSLLRREFPLNTVFEWQSCEQLAVLDLDFHQGKHPPLLELHAIAEALSPAPRCWWVSTGFGLKAVYWPLAGTPFTAEELACAAASYIQGDPRVVAYQGTVEVLSRTRAPNAAHECHGEIRRCGPVTVSVPNTEAALFARLSRAQATQEEIDEVLQLKSWSIGQRLAHEECVIDPHHASKSPHPVVILETGMYCHSCAARLGDGFRSWGSLRKTLGLAVGEIQERQPLRTAAEHFVHFSHVWYIMEALHGEIPPRFRAPVYRFLLKSLHGDDPRISQAFSDFQFVRGLDGWLCAHTLQDVRPLARQTVSCLPSVHYVQKTEDGCELETDPLKIEMHLNVARIPGWTPIVPFPWVPLYYHHAEWQTYDSGRDVVFAIPRKVYASKRVSYLPVAERFSFEECEQIIAQRLPGVNLQYMLALIVLMGYGESGQGPLPILWATGDTGAGKTVHAALVCSLYDEPVTNLSSLEDPHFTEGVAEASALSRLLVFDDPFKDSKRYPMLYRFFLQVTNRQLQYHKLYHGSRNVFLRNAVLITDRDNPAYFSQDRQFMRRCYRMYLHQPIKDLRQYGVDARTWWHGDDRLEKAASSYHSWIVDRYFPATGPRPIDEVMREFGAERLDRERRADIIELRQQRHLLLADLVREIIGHGGAKFGEEVAKRVGLGFIEVRLGDSSGISGLCTQLVESLGAVDLTGENLQRVADDIRIWPFLPKEGIIPKLEVRCRGKFRVYIRIAQDGLPAKSKSRLVNGECFVQPLVALNEEGVPEAQAS